MTWYGRLTLLGSLHTGPDARRRSQSGLFRGLCAAEIFDLGTILPIRRYEEVEPEEGGPDCPLTHIRVFTEASAHSWCCGRPQLCAAAPRDR
jgi:hypothetical protein